jgi:hypothetical protein
MNRGSNGTARLYSSQATAQPFDDDHPALGAAILALTELVIHIDTGRRRGGIQYHHADRLAVQISILADALNAMVPRPRQRRGLARWVRVEGQP